MQQLSSPENEHRFHYLALIIIWIYCRSGKLLQYAINQILALEWLPQVSGYQVRSLGGMQECYQSQRCQHCPKYCKYRLVQVAPLAVHSTCAPRPLP